jgi:hypothetical protein
MTMILSCCDSAVNFKFRYCYTSNAQTTKLKERFEPVEF